MIDVEQFLASKQAQALLKVAEGALEASPYYAGLAERLQAEATYVADVEGRRADRLARL